MEIDLMEDKMSAFGQNPEKLDPRKYGFDYGDGRPIVFDANLFKECPSCKGSGKINEEKCIDCDGTGAIPKDPGCI
jgi:hypothetical protein